MTDRLKQLSEAGVSIWLDDLSRERIETGNLADLVKNNSVVGVTTNPTIFAAALANGERYDDQLRSIKGTGDGGDDVGEAIFQLTTVLYSSRVRSSSRRASSSFAAVSST